MLVIAGAAFWAGHFTPPSALPELLQPSTPPAEPSTPLPQPNSKLLLQLETERNLAQAYSSRVEKLSARIASLQSEHSTELQRRLGQHQDEISRREKQLKDLEAKAASDSRAERAGSKQAESVKAKALAEAHAEQAQMRSELERLQKRLVRAQEVIIPPLQHAGCAWCKVSSLGFGQDDYTSSRQILQGVCVWEVTGKSCTGMRDADALANVLRGFGAWRK